MLLWSLLDMPNCTSIMGCSFARSSHRPMRFTRDVAVKQDNHRDCNLRQSSMVTAGQQLWGTALGEE
jgi:hypothetical protein